ncbi:putative heme iron utilization protein [Serpentinimonas raichei]|uniref:Putative heme iron utilization protein n=1 Tax=Serpentinimonas raichei TaxID=1458425 RepID=A0A060NQH9_9BURK|nr:pyridoxamine 5'-phosphate oxidase family protein [Serpentinimonas raichei]BAO81169.1 putative heme iron utilization protein [Serpentinimonas raichei]
MHYTARVSMTDADLHLLQRLLQAQRLAALATLHRGEPAASMVPFALLPECGSALIHVSRLATHSKDMQEQPAVALLILAEAQADDNPLARPRLSLKGRALPCPLESPRYAAARAAYLERLPEAQELFSFPDFSLFLVEPQAARFVAGFGRAYALTAERWRAVLAPTASAAGN